MGDAHQSIVKHVARRSDPVMFDFKSQCFYCEKPSIEDKKNMQIGKTLKLLVQ